MIDDFITQSHSFLPNFKLNWQFQFISRRTSSWNLVLPVSWMVYPPHYGNSFSGHRPHFVIIYNSKPFIFSISSICSNLHSFFPFLSQNFHYQGDYGLWFFNCVSILLFYIPFYIPFYSNFKMCLFQATYHCLYHYQLNPRHSHQSLHVPIPNADPVDSQNNS